MVFTGSRSAGRRSGSNRTTQRNKQLAAKSNRGDFTDQDGDMGVFAMLLFFHDRVRHVACIKKTNCINIKILIT